MDTPAKARLGRVNSTLKGENFMREELINAFARTAHRGLHDEAAGIPENSLPSFAAAVQEGVAIEMDLRPTADGTVLVVHDPIAKTNPTGKGLPKFKEALEVVNGSVPLLIELKFARYWKKHRYPYVYSFLCSLMKDLQGYQGYYAIQSFDYLFLECLKKTWPDVPRGYLLTYYNIFGNFGGFHRRADPHFIAYNIDALKEKWYKHYSVDKNIPLFTWTVDTPEKLEKSKGITDGIIYEKTAFITSRAT